MYYLSDSLMEFKIVAGIVADKVGVKIVQKGNRWQCNIKTKEIFYPENIVLSSKNLGVVIHEAAHLRFSIMDEDKMNIFVEEAGLLDKNMKQIFHLYNVIEDVRVNREISKLFIGAYKYLYSDSFNDYNDSFHDLTEAKLYSHEYNKWYDKSKWIQYYEYWYWYFELGKNEADFFAQEFCHPNTLKAIQDSSDIFIEGQNNLTSTFDSLDLLARLLEFYAPLCDDFTEKDKQEQEEMKNKLMEALEKFKEILIKAMESAEKDKKDKSGEGKMVVIKSDPTKKKDDLPKMKISKKIEQTFKEFCDSLEETYYCKPQLDIDKLNCFVNEHLSGIKKAVSIIKDSETTRYEGNYESGKLQNRKLYKLQLGSTKLFTRKVGLQNDNKDMAVALLVDESGSMQECKKCIQACVSSTLLGRAFEMIRKPLAIYGFNRSFFIHKDWNEKMSLEKMLDVEKNAYGIHAGRTNDGYAIWKTIQYLKKRPERNKILIVLSDGDTFPSGNDSEEGIPYNQYKLKEQAKEAEKVAKVYSIGILNDAVIEYNDRWVCIDKIEDLSKSLIKFFKENAGKRRK